ncbi:glycosyltransferase family 2 protein [Vibrio paracholerae]|uniref:glycosyltransferase family 2 protein n=1 Tax=Vibrio paracholerae TaxID=650003 RepID=UPI0020946C51|nr:glycosyltransferase family 2 protein [Vibrio paracholerae]MCO7019814.1 glycosyltransferase [Vibrio paracholerae]
MENSQLVSVIIPVYNKAHCIEKTIYSVLNQSFSNFEIIVVDDGSSDNSRYVIEKIVSLDSRCKSFYKDNGGVSSARNYGLSKAIGDFVSFLDADDIYMPDFLKEMTARSKDMDFVFCGHFISYESSSKKTKSRMNFRTRDFCLDYLLNRTTPNTNSWLINRKFLTDYMIKFDESLSWGEDMLFFSMVAYHANRYKTCDGFYTQYNMYNAGSLTQSFNYESKIEHDVLWLDKLNSYFVSTGNGKSVDKYLSAINEYRKPALIIYNLFSLLKCSSRDSFKVIYLKYKGEISNISLNNGLRSVKLYMYYYYLMIRFLF